jgi:hypothetical protein
MDWLSQISLGLRGSSCAALRRQPVRAGDASSRSGGREGTWRPACRTARQWLYRFRVRSSLPEQLCL